jgi:L-ascorbate metabolism protein UlaG (beta-lactamase superfamily)
MPHSHHWSAAVAFTAFGLTIASAQDRWPGANGDVTITALAHASVQIEHNGRVIQVDPWSRARTERAKPADLVLVTDADAGGHHLDPAAIRAVRKPGAPVVIPAIGREKVPDGTVLANGERGTFSGIDVEAIGAYDIKPGEPYHPKGEANGYVIALGGTRVYVAGVTECVPEMQALGGIDVAFMPMNLPLGRMAPAAVAACIRQFRPKVVYPYHYDQGYIPRLTGRAAPSGVPVIADTLRELADAAKGTGIEIRVADFYPAPAESASATGPAGRTR